VGDKAGDLLVVLFAFIVKFIIFEINPLTMLHNSVLSSDMFEHLIVVVNDWIWQ
jgi:hypothetical protein